MKKVIVILGILLQASFSLYSQPLLYGLNFKDNGNVLQYNLAANTLNSVYSLNTSEGEGPYNSLIQGTNGMLYGMTAFSGGNNFGTIFSFNPITSELKKLYDFDGTNGGQPSGGLVQASNKKLYGLSTIDGSGNIFSFDPVTKQYANLHILNSTDGNGLYGSLIESTNGKLFGLSYNGGNSNVASAGLGTIFSFDPATTTFKKLFEFNGINGANPYGTLVQAWDKKLYGTTYNGGSHNSGVIFSYDPSTATYTKLHDFDGRDGATPYSNLMQAANGLLYGTTEHGGNGFGSIFSFNPSNSSFTTLHEFNNEDGAEPSSALMQASNGMLYGMSELGGSYNLGVLYSLDPATSEFTKLQEFDGLNGSFPHYGALVEMKRALSSTGSTENGLTINIAPNPSNGYFNLRITNTLTNNAQVKILNAIGQVIEQRSVNANATLQFGSSYRPGTYFAEVIEGKQKVTVFLIKQ